MDPNIYELYRSHFWELRNLYNGLVGSDFFEQIEKAYNAIDKSLKSGGKILIFGNGGSAAEAQHFAAELVCRFEKERKALPAIALTTDTVILTAQSNDESFYSIFERQIEALGNTDDVAIGLTTSDAEFNVNCFEAAYIHSINIKRGFKAALEQKMTTIGLVSQKTKNLLSLIDYPIIIPHENTAVIQEAHLSVIHLLCKMIEKNL